MERSRGERVLQSPAHVPRFYANARGTERPDGGDGRVSLFSSFNPFKAPSPSTYHPTQLKAVEDHANVAPEWVVEIRSKRRNICPPPTPYTKRHS